MMKFKFLMICFTASFSYQNADAQAVVEDFKTTPTTQQGKQYPQVNSEGRVRVSIHAPQAKQVQIDIGAKKYDLVKDTAGVWTGTAFL